MKIRTRLTVIFFSIVIVVLTMICVSIYFFSADYRQEDFYRRLKNRAINTAKILMEVKEVNAELLRRMEQNNPASLPNQYIVIYDPKNEVRYSSQGTEPIPVDSALLNTVRLQSELKFTYGEYEVIGFLFRDQTDHFTIVAAATDVYGLDALANLRNVLLITFLISIVFVSFLGWVYAGRVLSPISDIVDEVSNITEVNLNNRLDEGNNRDELSKLAHTFNRMLARLQSAFSSQKNFIANASHEIKTPITVMSGEIEVTLLHDRDKDYYKRVLRSVLSGLKGLNRLSTQLLILAQTSTDQPIKNFSVVRIDDILWEVKEELLNLHTEYVIEILFDLAVRHESLQVNGDEQLLKIAMMNLVDNGCKYADDKKVTINIRSDAATEKIHVEFVNNGIGIQPEITSRIFDPFVRGMHNKKVKGSGIGLSLVKRIVELHHGGIVVDSVPQKNTRFIVSLPTSVVK
jgi:signal transduction histidine kinase